MNPIQATKDPTKTNNPLYAGTINIGGTATPTPITPALKAFNEQMVKGITTPTITTPTVPNAQKTVSVISYKDNPDGTTTNTLSDGTTSTVKYTKNADGSLTPTEVGSLFPYYDQNVSYLSEAAKYAKEKADTVIPTEEEARQQALKAMQAEIDATNALYADKLRRAQQQGQGLLGQTGAIQARRGLLGSDFGTAQTQNVNLANEENYSSIENERLVKINQIQTKAKEDATAQIAAKRAAKEAGLKEYVDYLSKEKTLKETALTGTIQDMLANKIDLKDFNDSEIENLAKSYGVTSSKLKSLFNQSKATKTAEANKLATEQAKAGRVTLTEGQRVYQIDPVTGEYKEIAYNPKTYAPKAASGIGGGLGSAYTGSAGSSVEPINIIEKAKTVNPIIAGYAEQLLSKNTTLSSIPEQYRNDVALATKIIGDAKGITVANQILKQLDNGIKALQNPNRSSMLSGSIAGKSIPFLGSPARFNQEVENFRTVLDTLRAAQTINAIPLMKGTGPLSNADMRILQNSQSELSPTLDEQTLLDKMIELRNELEPARAGSVPYKTMQPQGGVYSAPENQTNNVREQVEAAGYDYDQMKADGLTDEEILTSL